MFRASDHPRDPQGRFRDKPRLPGVGMPGARDGGLPDGLDERLSDLGFQQTLAQGVYGGVMEPVDAVEAVDTLTDEYPDVDFDWYDMEAMNDGDWDWGDAIPGDEHSYSLSPSSLGSDLDWDLDWGDAIPGDGIIEPTPTPEPTPAPDPEPASTPKPKRKTTPKPTPHATPGTTPGLKEYHTLPPTDLSHLDHLTVNPGFDKQAEFELADFMRRNKREPTDLELDRWMEFDEFYTEEQWRHAMLHRWKHIPIDVEQRAHNPYGYNCPMVAAAAELRCRGYDVTAAPSSANNISQNPCVIAANWRDKNGRVRQFTEAASRWGMEHTLESYPVGARFFIMGRQKNSGHIWIAQVEDDGHGGKRLHEYEFQESSRRDVYESKLREARRIRPGYVPRPSKPDANDPLQHIMSGEHGLQWMRVDDLQPTDRLLNGPNPRLSEWSRTPWVVGKGQEDPHIDRHPPTSRSKRVKAAQDSDRFVMMETVAEEYTAGEPTPLPDGKEGKHGW